MDDDFDFMQLEQIQGKYLGGQRSMIVSNGTGDKIDQKVGKIIAQAHMRAIEILKDNLDKLHEISDFLLKEETITGEQFMEILNKKPVENKENLVEEKAIDDEIKSSEDNKDNSTDNTNEDLKKDLEETLKENDPKSSNKDSDDSIALGSSENSNQDDK